MHDDPPEQGLIPSHSSISMSHSIPVSPGVQWHAVQLESDVSFKRGSTVYSLVMCVHDCNYHLQMYVRSWSHSYHLLPL